MTQKPEKTKTRNIGKQTLMPGSPLLLDPRLLMEDVPASPKTTLKAAKQTLVGGEALFPLDPNVLLGQENPSQPQAFSKTPSPLAGASDLFEDLLLEPTPSASQSPITLGRTPSTPTEKSPLLDSSTAVRNLFSSVGEQVNDPHPPLLGSVISSDNLPEIADEDLSSPQHQHPSTLPQEKGRPPLHTHSSPEDIRAALLSTRAWEEPQLQAPSSLLSLDDTNLGQTFLEERPPIPPMINTTLLEPPESHRGPQSIHSIEEPSASLAQNNFAQAKRTTVLPEVDIRAGQPTMIQSNKLRYEFKTTLGAGASGEVELARDNDIHRMVAIKRLKKDLHNSAALLRFAEEIRTVGSLEHANIIPIHDVGIDENGQYYFVMKHIQGVTLEHIIQQLQAGDAEYHAKYTFSYRTRICMEILRAMQFAHANGVIHRDLKPANIMVGPYGEVVVMDWGIAKRIRQTTVKDPKVQGFLEQIERDIIHSLSPDETAKERFFETRSDTLLGTPMYMSPEQALGQNNTLDERSDIYSLFVVFYEFLTLRHYLEDAQTLKDLLLGVVQRAPKTPLLNSHPSQPPIPADLNWFLIWGLQKKPEQRPQDVQSIIHRLQRIEDGYAPIQCPVTLNKRAANGFIHFINKHPFLSTFSALFAISLMIGGAIFFVRLFLPQ